MTKLMYQTGYTFSANSENETGYSGIQVQCNDCTLKAMIVSGTEMRAQSIAAFEHKSGIHALMQLKRDYGNNGMQDSQEYEYTVLQP